MPNAVVFIGPSLPFEEAKQILPDAEYLPPAKRGDLTEAVRAGATENTRNMLLYRSTTVVIT